MITVEEAKALAKSTLTHNRYRHEKKVVKAAKHLAKLYGADAQKSALAGWLHDILKEKNAATLLQMLEQDAIIAGNTAQRPLPIWHGPSAAIYAKYQLGVHDEEVLSAIACHTVGKVDMGLLDKILFVADMVSEDRDYPEAEELRRIADEDLDKAVLATMEQSIAFLQKKGRTIDEESVLVLHTLQAKRE